MAINKVVFGEDTLIDLTEDTVQPEDVAFGETFHDRSGALRTGTSSGTGGVPIELLEDTVGWTGRNKLKNTGTSRTAQTIIYTKNSDGSVSTSGTANADSNFFVNLNVDNLVVGKTYKLSGCPSGGSRYKYYIRIGQKTSASDAWGTTLVRDEGEGAEITIPSNDYGFVVNIGVISGQDVSGLTFYPMIRLASVSDDTYEPYHEDVDTAKANNSAIAPVENGTTASQAYAQGEHFMRNGDFCTAKTDIASGATLIEGSNYEVKKVSDSIEDLYSNIGILPTPVPDYIANSLPILKRDITTEFYSGSLRSEIAAGDFRNVRPGDYIVGSATGTIYYVACCDWMFNKGDQTNAVAQEGAYGTHHLGLMIYKAIPSTRMWAGYGNQDKTWRVSANDKGRCPWNAAADVDPTDTEAIGSNNTNISRTYNGASVSGYMGSFIRERIDAILLPECFQADFGSANVLKFRNINGKEVTTDKPSGGQSNWNGLTTAWAWYDRFLDLPSEVELYGTRIFGAAYDIGAQCEQLPLFRNASINVFFPRQDIWTKSVASDSRASIHNSYGLAGSYYTSDAHWACPLACIK